MKFERKESCIQEHLHKHFQTEGHRSFLNEAQLHLLIKQMENNMRTLKAMKP